MLAASLIGLTAVVFALAPVLDSQRARRSEEPLQRALAKPVPTFKINPTKYYWDQLGRIAEEVRKHGIRAADRPDAKISTAITSLEKLLRGLSVASLTAGFRDRTRIDRDVYDYCGARADFYWACAMLIEKFAGLLYKQDPDKQMADSFDLYMDEFVLGMADDPWMTAKTFGRPAKELTDAQAELVDRARRVARLYLLLVDEENKLRPALKARIGEEFPRIDLLPDSPKRPLAK